MSEESLQIAEKREVIVKGEKERYTDLNAEFQKITRRENHLLNDQCKEIDLTENGKFPCSILKVLTA